MVENWNSGNTVIFYGKDGDLAGPDREHAEVSMLALHLLQSALVYTSTPCYCKQCSKCRSSTTASAPTNTAL